MWKITVMKLQSPTTVTDNAAETPGDVLVTPREVCARLGLTPYDLGRRAIPRGVRPQLAAIGPHNEYRLVFTLADLDKIFSPTPEPAPQPVNVDQDKPAAAQAPIHLNFE